MNKQQTKITPVILAGGSGTRLWPLSREDMPKQFCKLDGEQSLFQKTILRSKDLSIFTKPLVLTSHKHASVVKTQLLEIDVEPKAVVLEPCGRDTAAAISLAVEIENNGENKIFLVMPSDHIIGDHDVFNSSILQAKNIVTNEGRIVTLGIKPTHPETGYGYLEAGAELRTKGGFSLAKFIEKPNQNKAEELISKSNVFWNAGIFMFDHQTISAEYTRFQPQMAMQIKRSVAHGIWAGTEFTPDMSIFANIKSISFDYAVMEHTKKAALVPTNPKWSDLGSWAAMWEIAPKDENNNAHRGDVYASDTSNNLIYSDGPTVGVSDLSDVVVVANRDAVLVTSRENAQGVKFLVEQMRENENKVAKSHCGENRPWGRFDSLDKGDMHQVKRIKVTPGGRLSLQYHHHRAEHWVVVSGVATVTVDEDVMALGPCQQVFIPQGAVHRLENFTDQDVEIIEVQYGHYLGEDDIVRVEDVYGRNPNETPSTVKTAA